MHFLKLLPQISQDLPPYSSYVTLECYTIITKKKIKNCFLQS